jgi:hypothetical protein
MVSNFTICEGTVRSLMYDPFVNLWRLTITDQIELSLFRWFCTATYEQIKDVRLGDYLMCEGQVGANNVIKLTRIQKGRAIPE